MFKIFGYLYLYLRKFNIKEVSGHRNFLYVKLLSAGHQYVLNLTI